MDRVWIGLALLSVFFIGFFRLREVVLKLTKRLSFLIEYHEKYVQLANSVSHSDYSLWATPTKIDPDLYHWLTLNAVRAQREVGVFGVGEYVSSFQLYKVRNYEFITHTIPKFRDDRIHPQEITLVDDILVRTIGFLEDRERTAKKDLVNPLKWFQYGIRTLVGLPARILNWFGIISDSMFDRLTTNSIFKVITGLVALIGFVSSIVGLVTGWDAFVKIVLEWASLIG